MSQRCYCQVQMQITNSQVSLKEEERCDELEVEVHEFDDLSLHEYHIRFVHHFQFLLFQQLHHHAD